MNITTTGAAAEFLPPDGPAREELLGLVRVGLKFKAQQVGRKPGELHRLVHRLVKARAGKMTFEQLLLDLGFEARRRELRGPAASPIERVDTADECVVYHGPAGRTDASFKRLRNLLTLAKKEISA